MLTWQTTDATDVTITGLGTVQASGSQQVTPTASGTYTLTATGPGGTKQATAQVTVTQPTPPMPPSTPTVSLAELAMHNTASDCWVAYDNKVYDITAFLPNHPGGAGQISPYCGTSGAFDTAFTNKHGTSKVPVLENQTFKGNLV